MVGHTRVVTAAHPSSTACSHMDTFRTRQWVRLGSAVLLASCGVEADPAPSQTGASGATIPAGAAPDVFVASLAETPDGSISVGTPVNRSSRPGYDNQPHFTPDGTGIWFTVQDGDDTDIHWIDLESGDVLPVTSSAPESEYSAAPIPGRATFAAVRVEADSAQRLWEFEADGTALAPLLPDLHPVGYHGWADERTVVMFVLGDPPTLQVANMGTGEVRTADEGIGRSIQRIPGTATVSYERVREDERWIMAFDPATDESRPLVQPLDGAQDHAWTPAGTLLMGQGSVLHAVRPSPDGVAAWEAVADLSAHGGTITRLAVSPDGHWLALVMDVEH